MSINYDKNIDYQAKINEAIAKGDKKTAMQYEVQRNSKIADINKTGTNTGNFEKTYAYKNEDAYGLYDEVDKPKVNTQQVQQYSQPLNDLLSAVKTYNYPEMSNYKFDDIQNKLSNLTNQVQNYQGADYMGRDEATARANSQLTGMYSQNLDNTLNEYNKDAISRGMFGQLPVEALKQNAIAENELNKSNAVNSLGSEMYSQDFNMAQQKNNNYYAQINRLSDLIGQQHNVESSNYQNDVNSLLNQFNIDNQQMKNTMDIFNNEYDIKNTEEKKYANNIGQFSNDYMEEINRVQGDNNPSNDWQVGYLNNARNQKISGQDAAQADSQSQTYKQAMDMFTKLGYASGWVAQALGLPEGTTTASYSKGLGGGGSSGSGGSTEPKLTELSPTQMTSYMEMAANDLLNRNDEGYTPTRDEIFSETAKLLKALGYNSSAIDSYLSDIGLQTEIEQEMQNRTIKNDYQGGNLPGLGGSIWDLVK